MVVIKLGNFLWTSFWHVRLFIYVQFSLDSRWDNTIKWYPLNVYHFKFNNKNIRKRCETKKCSKLTKKYQNNVNVLFWCLYCIVNFEYISHFFPIVSIVNFEHAGYKQQLQSGEVCWPWWNKEWCLTLSWRKSLSYKNQSIDLLCNQWTGFYMIGTSIIKELNLCLN